MRDKPGSELGSLFMAVVLVLGRNGRLSDPEKASWHGGDEKLTSTAWELDTEGCAEILFCLLKGEGWRVVEGPEMGGRRETHARCGRYRAHPSIVLIVLST